MKLFDPFYLNLLELVLRKINVCCSYYKLGLRILSLRHQWYPRHILQDVVFISFVIKTSHNTDPGSSSGSCQHISQRQGIGQKTNSILNFNIFVNCLLLKYTDLIGHPELIPILYDFAWFFSIVWSQFPGKYFLFWLNLDLIFEFFQIEFYRIYRIYRICRILFLVILKFSENYFW